MSTKLLARTVVAAALLGSTFVASGCAELLAVRRAIRSARSGPRKPALLWVSTSHYQWGGHGLFDPMPLGGESPQVHSWQVLGMYGLAQGGCGSAFLPLLGLGTSEPLLVSK